MFWDTDLPWLSRPYADFADLIPFGNYPWADPTLFDSCRDAPLTVGMLMPEFLDAETSYRITVAGGRGDELFSEVTLKAQLGSTLTCPVIGGVRLESRWCVNLPGAPTPYELPLVPSQSEATLPTCYWVGRTGPDPGDFWNSPCVA